MTDVIDGDLIFSGAPPSGSFIVSYRRPANYIGRRDMVRARSDNLALQVTVVQTDDPDSQALLLTGGLGGPELRMVVRRPEAGVTRDYGLYPGAAAVLATIDGTISETSPGTFDLVLASGGMTTWPARCYFEIQLNNPSGSTSCILTHGMLHLSGGSTVASGEIPLLTDTSDPVLDDNSVAIDIV